MLGIVVLTYNSWSETELCVKSILDLNTTINYNIYLVDNCSTIEPTKKIIDFTKQENIKYIRTKSNRGYSAGNNIGISAALKDGCDYFLISNNDVEFKNNVIEKLLTFIQSHNNVGIVAPKIILGSGETQETNMGCKMTLSGKYKYILRKTPLKAISKKFLLKFRVDIDKESDPVKVFAVSGCYFLISKECIDRIGMFDEHTFLFQEENIIGCKMEKQGLDTYIIPSIYVVHHHGQTTKSTKALAFIYATQSEIYYCKKYLNANALLLLPLYIFRTLEYISRIKEADYRNNIRQYFNKVHLIKE